MKKTFDLPRAGKEEGDQQHQRVIMSAGEEGFGYAIWVSEPQSVEERRQKFLSQMGISEEVGSGSDDHRHCLLQRISQCREEAEMSSCGVEEESGSISPVCFERDQSVSEANSMADGDDDTEVEEEEECDGRKSGEESSTSVAGISDGEEKVKIKSWWSWKKFGSGKKREEVAICEVSSSSSKVKTLTKVKSNKKRYMELTGLLVGQEIQAHKGIIWTMKFSPDGQYLATGGEDGIVRVWGVGTTTSAEDPSAKSFFTDQGSKKGGVRPSIVVPERVFSIEESPVHEFLGHSSDVLDLAWSSSNLLLSSSKDKTVRLWRVGCNDCINVFRHGNYVTCIQFNPVDENSFISGSIDGKVRIWGVYEARVIDWTDVRDVISAICYRPDGKEFVVGTIRGTCRFYDVSGQDMQLKVDIHIQGRKRTSSNRITGIQFSQENAPKVMITSEDSKVRIFDGFDLVHKFKGLTRSGSQMSANFTSTGKHIISVGEDCQVYVWNWNYQDHHHTSNSLLSPSSNKHIKSEQSFEHFFSQSVSVATPWPGSTSSNRTTSRSSSHHGQQHQGATREVVERFSLGNWCQFMDGGGFRANLAATWPEERLLVAEEEECGGGEAWGMVIVTASYDGKITSFNNYGMPVLL